jgi:hypothetical protein
MLHSTLERLVELGVREQREEPDLQYRWCFHLLRRHG